MFRVEEITDELCPYDWDEVERAKEALYDYYFNANHYYPSVILEYGEICEKGPEAVLAAARELGL